MTPSFATPATQGQPPHQTGCEPRDQQPIHVGGSMHRVAVAGPCGPGRLTFMLLADAVANGTVEVVRG